jgi:GTPase Era involved in 16S rRNA processing
MIPEFAVLGHPNEGKSSVVSTLTEDDKIKVSSIPGETTVSKTYTVKIDGESIIRFVDTPGFQVPRQTLAWFKAFDGDPALIIEQFIDTFKNDPFYADECELLSPVARGAGIIYVVDASRPVRDDDLAEMEILRLTGCPRMAIINSKTNEKDYTQDWKLEFRKHFNSIRTFNSNTANFTERIKMLESLKAIDQEWESQLSYVILSFEKDWLKRNALVCSHIMKTIEQSLSFSVSCAITGSSDQEKIKEKLTSKYQVHIKDLENQMFKKIRGLFKHILFEYQPPEYSILKHDLFSKQTWELLGLTREQLATAGANIGITMGAVIDTAAAGITFGVFTALGGILGAGSALLGGKKIAKKKTTGFSFGGDKLVLGPNKNLQFLYILIDRALIYYSQIVKRPHGRRDIKKLSKKTNGEKQGYSTGFTTSQRNICAKFFKIMTGHSFVNGKKTISDFEDFIESVLADISKD